MDTRAGRSTARTAREHATLRPSKRVSVGKRCAAMVLLGGLERLPLARDFREDSDGCKTSFFPLKHVLGQHNLKSLVGAVNQSILGKFGAKYSILITKPFGLLVGLS